MAKKEPVLSICMPTYNRSECVRASLSHYLEVIGQNSLDGKIEICISDNSTNGETEEVVKGFSGRLRMRYRRNRKNLGYDRNVVLAMSLATGKYAQLVGDELFYYGPALAEAVGVLEAGECGAVYFDDDGLFLKKQAAGLYVSGVDFLGKALSYEWVKKRSITHIDYIIIRRQDFETYLASTGNGLEKFYGMTFIQLSFYFHAFKRCESIRILGRVNDPKPQNIPKKVGVYFPADDARVFYCKYFFEHKLCWGAGILDEAEYSCFKRSFFLSAINHLLRIRTHMYPPIYGREEAEVLQSVKQVENEFAGMHKAGLALLRSILFIKALPYHWLYMAFVFYRNRILGQPRVSALELYEKCLSGEKMSESKLYKTDF